MRLCWMRIGTKGGGALRVLQFPLCHRLILRRHAGSDITFFLVFIPRGCYISTPMFQFITTRF